MQADRMVKIFTDILTNKAKIAALTRAYNCKWTSITPAAVADSGRLHNLGKKHTPRAVALPITLKTHSLGLHSQWWCWR
eukprot:1851380-Prymnesium_polylepis.1